MQTAAYNGAGTVYPFIEIIFYSFLGDSITFTCMYTTAEIEFISLFFFLLWQVILRQSLYLGGVPTFEIVSPYIPVRVPFSGCIQKVSLE